MTPVAWVPSLGPLTVVTEIPNTARSGPVGSGGTDSVPAVPGRLCVDAGSGPHIDSR